MIFRILEDQYAEKSKLSKAADQRFMQLALSLGRRGQGRTWPNPAVGAVVVKHGVIVGRGWTQAGGRPHAEVEALGRAGAAARGATLYATLEPCSHFGKSPPCADAVIAAGIQRVVSAIVRELESGGEAEVSSEAIGEIVMEHLRQLDDVAYVRFASVYRNFREAKDFEAVLGELSGDEDARPALLRK